jgi:hypothetical protein
MTTFTIDTHHAANRLIDAGFDAKQATEIVDLLVKSQDGLLTKEFFKEYLDYKLEKEISPIRQDNVAIKTTLAIIVGGIVTMLVKTFS